MVRLWNPICSLNVHSRENEYFFFQFGEREECEIILQMGPCVFVGMLIVLRRWSEKLD